MRAALKAHDFVLEDRGVRISVSDSYLLKVFLLVDNLRIYVRELSLQFFVAGD